MSELNSHRLPGNALNDTAGWRSRAGHRDAQPSDATADSALELGDVGAATSAPAGPLPFLHPVDAAPRDDGKRAIRLPSSVEPAAVVRALLYNSSSAGMPLAAHLWLADPSSETLRLVHAEGSARPDSTPVPIDGTVLGSALRKAVAQIEPVHRLKSAHGDAVVWRYALPVNAGELRGVAAVDFEGPRKPNLERFTPIAGAMRGTLSGAIALHIARIEAASARALSDTTRDLAKVLDPDDVVATALERAIAISGAQTGSVMLLDETGCMRIIASQGLPTEVVEQACVAEGEGIAGWVLASGQSLIVEDLNDQSRRSRRHGVRSAVSVPIGDSDGVLGVINVGSRSFQAKDSRSNLEALESLGRSTAASLRNARAVALAHDLYFDTLEALAVAMEAKDPYAYGATARVAQLSLALGRAVGMSADELDALRVASLLHDIGMSAAGDVVAMTSRQLSTVEWGMLKVHPVIAAEILSQAPSLGDAVPIVYHHHEHFDGSGYVSGISGESIPLGSRVLAVADTFVALTSDRPYRTARSTDDALHAILDESGAQFDPQVVAALVDILSDGSTNVPSVD